MKKYKYHPTNNNHGVKMMKNHRNLVTSLAIVITTTIMLIPWNASTVCATNSGQIGGNTDKFWDGSWTSTVTKQVNDPNVGTWEIGLDIDDVDYRWWNGDQTYNTYLDELTIPWIRIKMANGPYIIYPHSDTTTFNALRYNTWGYYENPEEDGDNSTFTQIWARYYLDFDGDQLVEWSFIYVYEFYGKVGYDGVGYILSGILLGLIPSEQINPVPAPKTEFCHQMPGGAIDYVEQIDFVWILDADVHDDADNVIRTFDGQQWNTAQTEESHADDPIDYDPHGRQVMIRNGGDNREVAIFCCYDVNASEQFYCLRSHHNEYHYWPTNLDNNENINDKDVELWWVVSYYAYIGWPTNYQVNVGFYNFDS